MTLLVNDTPNSLSSLDLFHRRTKVIGYPKPQKGAEKPGAIKSTEHSCGQVDWSEPLSVGRSPVDEIKEFCDPDKRHAI